MPVIGIVTCQILELEIAHMLSHDEQIDGITVLHGDYSGGLIESLRSQDDPRLRVIGWIPEFEPSSPDRLDVLVEVVKLGLHIVIKDLKEGVTSAVREISPYVDAVMLGYGLCGNAMEKPEELFESVDVPVFMVMDEDHIVDDCIGMLIGGRENYYEEQCKVAGTMFMTPGFVRHWKDLLHKSLGGMYDLEMSKRMLKDYERSLLMPTGVMSLETMEEQIQEFNELYGLRTEFREGTVDLLHKTFERVKRFVIQHGKPIHQHVKA
ncbi:MAG: DUF1638 domain-containing protein [Desulfomonilaceae bacterium]|nr:DUF1638 domain-containing protein [Desulfomonilaceae bacterium]